jgi:hypothetical protein
MSRADLHAGQVSMDMTLPFDCEEADGDVATILLLVIRSRK